MADEITIRDDSKPYTPCPEGQHLAVCADVILLGDKVESYPGNPPKVVKKLALVYQVDEINPDTGKRFEISTEKTVSMNEKAGLRKWLEAWRGKAYSDQEAKEKGVQPHKMVGVNALLAVAHKTSGKGKLYANAMNIAPIHKSMTPIAVEGYERGEFWTKRKEEYAKQVADFLRAAGQDGPPPSDYHPEDEDDDLPF